MENDIEAFEMGYTGDHSAIRLVIYLMQKTGKKPRWIWNVFWGALLAFWSIFYIYSTMILISGVFSYQTVQIYEKYEQGYLYTDVDAFEIETEMVEVDISNFLVSAKSGDRVRLTISRITGELIKIQLNECVLYELPLIPSAIWIQQPLCLLLLGCGVFMVVVVNLKNPKGYLKKLQHDMNIE